MRFTPKSFAVVVALGVAGVATPAVAQDAAPAPAPEQNLIEPTEEQLEAFVSAFIEVNQIATRYTPQIQAAATEEEAQQIQQQAELEMIAAVEDTVLTVDIYTSILDRAEVDEDFAALLQQRIDAAVEALPAEDGE